MSAVSVSRTSDRAIGAYAVQGAIGGVVAGAMMAVAEMVWSAAAGMGFWMPLQMMASVPIGKMPPEIGLGTAIPLGMMTHMVMSMMFGIVFAIVVYAVPALRSRATLLASATVYGFMLWAMNFFIVAPILGRPWFAESDSVQQVVSHAMFFGTVLGLYLSIRVTSSSRA